MNFDRVECNDDYESTIPESYNKYAASLWWIDFIIQYTDYEHLSRWVSDDYFYVLELEVGWEIDIPISI
jgi:hypothetical protein